ncbi:MAG TPA: hypothetical protein DF383_02480, partial [Deltaproteobacteria bacterium]|nr:hypothetical protein [Deltaproteobacteria bacterium]
GFVASARAGEALPEPPRENPNPPQSADDKRRVDFAVQEIKAQYGPDVTILHPHIIPWSFEKFINNTKPSAPSVSQPPPASSAKSSASGGLIMASQPMRGPDLKPDEYMVHAYVKFPNDPSWYHVDVILSEDASGKLTRRGFYKILMPAPSVQLPPGVVC